MNYYKTGVRARPGSREIRFVKPEARVEQPGVPFERVFQETPTPKIPPSALNPVEKAEKRRNRTKTADKVRRQLRKKYPSPGYCEKCGAGGRKLHRHHAGLSMKQLVELGLENDLSKHRIIHLCVVCHAKKHEGESAHSLLKAQLNPNF